MLALGFPLWCSRVPLPWPEPSTMQKQPPSTIGRDSHDRRTVTVSITTGKFSACTIVLARASAAAYTMQHIALLCASFDRQQQQRRGKFSLGNAQICLAMISAPHMGVLHCFYLNQPSINQITHSVQPFLPGRINLCSSCLRNVAHLSRPATRQEQKSGTKIWKQLP